jgi:hypothetical protein
VRAAILRQAKQGTDVQENKADQDIPELQCEVTEFSDKSCDHLEVAPFRVGVPPWPFVGGFVPANLLESVV